MLINYGNILSWVFLPKISHLEIIREKLEIRTSFKTLLAQRNRKKNKILRTTSLFNQCSFLRS